VLGNVGTASRGEYTVIGDTVNVAARLTDLAKKRPGRVLALGQTVLAAGGEQHGWHPIESRILRGRSAPSEIWEHRDVALAPSVGDSADQRSRGSTWKAG
jgi:adenylate cyclase